MPSIDTRGLTPDMFAAGVHMQAKELMTRFALQEFPSELDSVQSGEESQTLQLSDEACLAAAYNGIIGAVYGEEVSAAMDRQATVGLLATLDNTETEQKER